MEAKAVGEVSEEEECEGNQVILSMKLRHLALLLYRNQPVFEDMA